MSISTKDFSQLADVIRGRKHLIPKGQEAGWQVAIEAVASGCQLLNSRFNRDVFFEACGCNSWDDVKSKCDSCGCVRDATFIGSSCPEEFGADCNPCLGTYREYTGPEEIW